MARKTYDTVYNAETDKRQSWPSVEVMAKLLWELPTTKIAAQIGVSDTAVKKFARAHGLVKPARGYWAKKYALEAEVAKATKDFVKELNALEAELDAAQPCEG